METGPVLLTKDEYEKYFKNHFIYGRDGVKWPREVIVFYQYSLIRDTEFENENIISSWKRCDSFGGHAEMNMIENLREELLKKQDKSATLLLTVYGSYSPCHVCSRLLITFFGKMAEKFRDVAVEIRFQSFYKFPFVWNRNSPTIDFASISSNTENAANDRCRNRNGILDLLRYNKVKTLALIPDSEFTYDQFLTVIGIPTEKQQEWLGPFSDKLNAKIEITANWMQDLRMQQDGQSDLVSRMGGMNIDVYN